MIGSNRKGIWFAAFLLLCSQGCRQRELRPAADSVAIACAPSVPLPMAAAIDPTTTDPRSVIPVSHQIDVDAPPQAFEPVALEPIAADSFAIEPDQGLPTPSSNPPVQLAESSQVLALDQLSLDHVLQSVFASFPLLRAELAEREVADGRTLSACGPYDLNLEMYGIAAPMGYYKNYRNGVVLKQAVYSGGYIYGGYRNGQDDIQPWFKERLTNEGGEFKVGAGVPLLQGRQIDKYRAEMMTSDLARSAVEPRIQGELLQFVLAASDAYWSWVAAGRMFAAQEQLLQLATTRVLQIEERVRSGDLERIALIDNQRLIASRETKLIEAKRKLQAAAIKLSLFLRDACGEPLVPESQQLPADFPTPRPYDDQQLPGDIEQAWAARPELQYLDLQVEQIRVELGAAENQLLPKVDARLEASKDIGAAADLKNDKTPFELEAGIWGELPLQRRQAQGKIQSLQGKLSQMAAKRQYTADKVAIELRDAVSALQAAAGRIQRARTTVDLAGQSLDLGRQGFESGDLTVVTLNLYEQAVMEAELQSIEAQADFFKARAAYQAALGADPWQLAP